MATIATSGADYTSLAACEAGEQADFTGLGVQTWEYTEAFEDTSSVDIDGSTTTASDYILVTVASGVRHDGLGWDTTAARLNTSGAVSCIDVADEFVRIVWLQIQYSGTTSSASCIEYPASSLSSSSRQYVENCILVQNNSDETDTHNNGIWYNNEVSPTSRFSNNLIYNIGASSGGGIRVGAVTTYAYNNTVHGFNGSGYSGSGLRAKNCRGTSNTTDFDTIHAASDYNLSADATAPGENAVPSATVDYTDAANGDFSLGATDDGIDAGTDLSSDGDYAISTDITGATRSGTWEIGALQYTSSGATTTLTANSTSFTLTFSDVTFDAGIRIDDEATNATQTNVVEVTLEVLSTTDSVLASVVIEDFASVTFSPVLTIDPGGVHEQQFTLLAGRNIAAFNAVGTLYVGMYELLSAQLPPAGTYTVQSSHAQVSNPTPHVLNAKSLANVVQSTPSGDAVKSEEGRPATSASLELTTSGSGKAFDLLGGLSTQTPSWGSGQSETFSDTASNNVTAAGSVETVVDAATVTMSVTFSSMTAGYIAVYLEGGESVGAGSTTTLSAEGTSFALQFADTNFNPTFRADDITFTLTFAGANFVEGPTPSTYTLVAEGTTFDILFEEEATFTVHTPATTTLSAEGTSFVLSFSAAQFVVSDVSAGGSGGGINAPASSTNNTVNR